MSFCSAAAHFIEGDSEDIYALRRALIDDFGYSRASYYLFCHTLSLIKLVSISDGLIVRS